jgi:NAD(P)-dependent dehydrogenase (short-subunit alcohol dehydrogenase family)
MNEHVALVTGASSGIGRATAGLMASRGFRVFGTSRAPNERAANGVPLLRLDVRDDASVEACVSAVLGAAGRVDVLVNCAGYMQSGAIEENDVAGVRAQFETNVFGVLRMTNAVVPHMRRQGGGRIVNVSSVLGLIAPAYAGVYGSSKFALEGLSEALRAELRPFGIQVSLVEPAFVRSEIVGQAPARPLAEYEARRRVGERFAREGVERGMDPGVVAQSILSVVEASRPRLRNPVGGTSHVLSALKRVLPEWAFEILRGRAFPAEA